MRHSFTDSGLPSIPPNSPITVDADTLQPEFNPDLSIQEQPAGPISIPSSPDSQTPSSKRIRHDNSESQSDEPSASHSQTIPQPAYRQTTIL